METIRNCIYGLYKHQHPPSSKQNIKSSVMSQKLGDLENTILQEAVKLYDPNDIGALCFDGFLLKKEVDPKFDELNNIGKPYGIVFCKKEWDNTLQIPEDYLGYAEKKVEFEKNYFILEYPFNFCQIIDGDINFLKHAEFNILTKNLNFDSERWISDPTRTQYSRMDFLPYSPKQTDPTPPNVYNIFKPFVTPYIPPEKRCDTSQFYDHVLVNLCDHKKEEADWLMKVFAWRFQNPGKRPETCIILRGKEGAGKDRTTDIFENIMGQDRNYLLKDSSPQNIFGQFNASLSHKLFVQINEMQGRDGVRFKEELKDLITRKTSNLNQKNVKIYSQTNNVLVFIFSNNLTPVQIHRGNRRFVVIKTGEDNIGNHTYWEKFSEFIEDPEWLASLYSNFLDLPLGNFRPDRLADQPKTEETENAILDNISVVYESVRWWDWDSDIFVEKNGLHYATVNMVKKLVSDTAIDTGNRTPSSNSLYKQLRELKGVISVDVSKRFKGPVVKTVVFNRKLVEEEIEEMFSHDVIEDLDIDAPDSPSCQPCWEGDGLDK
jgi:hypothetical protein